MECYEKYILLHAAERTIGSTKGRKKKGWISSETYELSEAKRKAKKESSEKYKYLKSKVQN